MRANTLSAVLTSIALLSGCATVAEGPAFSDARAVTPMAGRATVYVFRKYAEPTAWGATVHFDDQEVATLNQGGFTWAYLTPGKRRVRAVWAGMSGQRDSEIGLDVKAGNTYYVELTGISKMTGSGPGALPGTITIYYRIGSGMSEVNPAVAELVLSQCCKFQKPRSTEY
jgi:hypothetical protein